MRAYRLLGLFIATAAVLLITPGTAHAEPGYPIEQPASSVSEGVVSDGDSVVFIPPVAGG